ncbi:MAG: inositol monophosphatase, partial [Deltaproteobacteria bacterium]|nr:inositol monophosphatase [Deltaproteobacteria bacterium]
MGTALERVREVAVATAKRAGRLLREQFGRTVAVHYKGKIDLVTEMDRASQTLIVDTIRASFREHAILSEEGVAERPGAAERWIIDPLDGTVNYAHSFPVFAVSIGVADAQAVQVGVVYDPMRDELFTAQRGQPAWLNGVRLAVSGTTELQRSILATGFPYDRRRNADNNHREFVALNLASQGVRRAGSAALDLAYVASGRLDGYWEQRLGPWDVAAGSLLVECAGGTLST